MEDVHGNTQASGFWVIQPSHTGGIPLGLRWKKKKLWPQAASYTSSHCVQLNRFPESIDADIGDIISAARHQCSVMWCFVEIETDARRIRPIACLLHQQQLHGPSYFLSSIRPNRTSGAARQL